MLHPVLGTVLHLGLRADGRALRPCASSRNVPVAGTQSGINECMALPAGHFKIKEQIKLPANFSSGCDSKLKCEGPSCLVQAGYRYGMGDVYFIGDVHQNNAACHKDPVISYCCLEYEEFWSSPSPGLSLIENIEDGYQICITGV